MDPKQSKRLAITLIIVGLVLALIIIIADGGTTPEERVSEIDREIREIREEITELQESDISEEERQEGIEKLRDELAEYEEELNNIEG